MLGVICLNCRAERPPEDSYCGKCGEQLPVICLKCGAENPWHFVRCKVCEAYLFHQEWEEEQEAVA